MIYKNVRFCLLDREDDKCEYGVDGITPNKKYQ